MEAIKPRYSKEEFARRGDEIYEKSIRPCMKKSDVGKFIVIDIETGDYEIAASDRLLARIPEAQVWLRRVGSKYARSFGPRFRPEEI